MLVAEGDCQTWDKKKNSPFPYVVSIFHYLYEKHDSLYFAGECNLQERIQGCSGLAKVFAGTSGNAYDRPEFGTLYGSLVDQRISGL